MSISEAVLATIKHAYFAAQDAFENDTAYLIEARLNKEIVNRVKALARIKHAGRGVALTLSLYKATQPEQDIRRHKSEHEGGFSARSIDQDVTVPFLQFHSLPVSVQSHWLTQTFSFAGPFFEDSVLKTQPKAAGPLVVQVVNDVEVGGESIAEAIAILILIELIALRNRNKVLITRPKGLTIDAIMSLLDLHMEIKFKTGRPRLPQLAIYAIYQCMIGSMRRYEGCSLDPLARMKSADRKAGTIGDVVVSHNGSPIEAVETKSDEPVNIAHLADAIDKIRSAAVRRYLILSTASVDETDRENIDRVRNDFRRSNGCEIVVNGVQQTISYYLRLLPDPTDFILNYAALLEVDPDLDYEHRIAWNRLCTTL